MTRKSKRSRQHLGIGIAILLALGVGLASNFVRGEWLLAPGKMTPGHGDLSCESCHQKAPGNLRQQLQAKAQFYLGNRDTNIELGFSSVSNTRCLECHRRPKDRHPVFRFFEPRFAKVRQAIQPHRCTACHREHQHQRVSSPVTVCMHCHEKLDIKRDSLKVTHKRLVKEKRWSTCLSCHDYHGNHRIKPPTEMAQRFSEDNIAQYLVNGESPYPLPKKYKAKERLDDE